MRLLTVIRIYMTLHEPDSESVWQVSEVSCCADAIRSQKTGREITGWP